MSANLRLDCMTAHSLFWSAHGTAQLGRSLNSCICPITWRVSSGRLLTRAINSYMELDKKTPRFICCLSGSHCLKIIANILLTYIMRCNAPLNILKTAMREKRASHLWRPYVSPVTAHKQSPVINASIIPHESLRAVSLFWSEGWSAAEWQEYGCCLW